MPSTDWMRWLGALGHVTRSHHLVWDQHYLHKVENLHVCVQGPGACYDMSCTVGDSVQHGLVLAAVVVYHVLVH